MLGVFGAFVIGHSAKAAPTDAQAAQRGAYLAIAADCMACHTKPGGPDYGGGYAIQSPVGVIYSSNITPSKDAGIGNWTEAQFVRAVREGVSADGHYLYPAMPYDAYSGITDRDIHDLYVYFQTSVAPVNQPVTAKTKLRFPFNIRFLMVGWNTLFLGSERFAPKVNETPVISRGRYLVDNLAHCGTCHTPRNIFMTTKTSRYLQGAPVGGWIAPDISNTSQTGIGTWGDDEIIAYLRDGRARDRGVAAGPMGEAVEHSFRFLHDDDLRAIVAYLRSHDDGPHVSGPDEMREESNTRSYGFSHPEILSTLKKSRDYRLSEPKIVGNTSDFTGVKNGALLYEAACASCHQLNGKGLVDDYYPSLVNNSTVSSTLPNNLLMTILSGVHREGNDGTASMPAFRHELTDEQIVLLAQYVSTTFGNGKMKVGKQDVTAARALDVPAFAAHALPVQSKPLNTGSEVR